MDSSNRPNTSSIPAADKVTMPGRWAVCRHGAGVVLATVAAPTKLAAMKRAAKQLGVPWRSLAALQVRPPTVMYRPRRPAERAGQPPAAGEPTSR
ncbi:MAG: hypothetical protein U0804_17100 [Gemmataceae bacterium]